MPDTAYICLGNELILNAGYNDYATYLWQDGTTDQFYPVQEPGVYWVAIENDGCIVYDTININICSSIWVPSAFTPDGNNINDVWFPKSSTPLAQYTLTIFNRWGEIVFESTDITKGWDGQKDSSDCPQGVYIYVITYIGQANLAEDREGKIRGSVTLIR
jgi:gliding motility-associated-like protein